MARMKTLFTYALIVILFYLFSNFAIDVMISNSYRDVSKCVKIEESDNGFVMNIDTAKSNKRQGFFIGTVKNTSDKVIEKQYVKVDSYYKGRLMQTKYLAFENLQPGEERKFKLVYSVGNIDEFRVSYVDEIPIRRTMIDDAIDTVRGFLNKVMEKVKEWDTMDWNDVGNALTSAKDNIFGRFQPVHVEGEDWQLLTAVLMVLYFI